MKEENKLSDKAASKISSGLFGVLLICFIFLAVDFVYLRTTTYGEWLIADYGQRIIVIAVILFLPPLRSAVRNAIRFNLSVFHFLAAPLFIAFLVIASHFVIEVPIYRAFPEAVLFKYPPPTSDVLHAFDLSIGLVMVAVSEEFTFRVLVPRFLSNHIGSATVVLVLSSLLFGLIHWSHGPGSVTVAFIAGLMWMVLVRRSGSVVPAIISHFLANLWFFW